MLGLLLWIAAAVLVGVFARRRGRSLGGWIAIAVVVSPVLAVIALLILPPNAEQLEADLVNAGTHVTCRHCGELVRIEATRCSHCAGELPRRHSRRGPRFEVPR
jgi:hypothetical protein